MKNSVIKGYHVYEVKPPRTNPPTRLVVEREYTNIHDVNASLVWIPELANFNQDLHDMYTDQKRFLKLSDVAGLPVGHVPLGLGGAFRKLLDKSCSIFSEPIGDPCASFPPWPPTHEKGGGVVIPCDYIVLCAATKLNFVRETLSAAVMEMPERDAMSIQ